jgi:uncharacterized membrane protein YphA (DoxX/SURF4 family)
VSTVATIASVVVGLSFVLAGGSKLAAGPSWPSQAAGLGAPPWSIPVVPWLELAIGATLVVQVAAPVPAVAALCLLIAFTILIGWRLSQGRHPPCACFGAWSATPIGPAHLVRNGVLIALAGLALVG